MKALNKLIPDESFVGSILPAMFVQSRSRHSQSIGIFGWTKHLLLSRVRISPTKSGRLSGKLDGLKTGLVTKVLIYLYAISARQWHGGSVYWETMIAGSHASQN